MFQGLILVSGRIEIHERQTSAVPSRVLVAGPWFDKYMDVVDWIDSKLRRMRANAATTLALTPGVDVSTILSESIEYVASLRRIERQRLAHEAEWAAQAAKNAGIVTAAKV